MLTKPSDVEHSGASGRSPPGRNLPQLQFEGFETSPYDVDLLDASEQLVNTSLRSSSHSTLRLLLDRRTGTARGRSHFSAHECPAHPASPSRIYVRSVQCADHGIEIVDAPAT